MDNGLVLQIYPTVTGLFTIQSYETLYKKHTCVQISLTGLTEEEHVAGLDLLAEIGASASSYMHEKVSTFDERLFLH